MHLVRRCRVSDRERCLTLVWMVVGAEEVAMVTELFGKAEEVFGLEQNTFKVR